MKEGLAGGSARAGPARGTGEGGGSGMRNRGGGSRCLLEADRGGWVLRGFDVGGVGFGGADDDCFAGVVLAEVDVRAGRRMFCVRRRGR